MRLPAPTGGGDFKPLPAGTHTAICTRVIDLGSQVSTFQGKSSEKHKIMLTWEVPDELMDDGRPFTVSKRYTFSMHEKAVLRKDLESWRGQPFVDADFGQDGFDIKNLLDKPCTVVVSHTTEGDKTYTNVEGVGPRMKGITPGKRSGDLVYLTLEEGEFDRAVFDGLHDRLQDVIKKSPEWQALNGPSRSPSHSGQDYKGKNAHGIEDDDIPF